MPTITDVIAPPRHQDGKSDRRVAGSDKSLKPLLLLAHIDVVEANRADWERDPFKLVEEEGFSMGAVRRTTRPWRGVADSMVRFKKDNYRPKAPSSSR